MIELERLRFGYGGGGFELRVPLLTIEQGEKVALIGPSGSGKTTLVHLIAGILTPTAGTIRVAGVELSGQDDGSRRDFRSARIGFVFQEFELLEYLTACDNILLPYYLNSALELTAEVRATARRLGESVGLGDKLSRRPGQLSQGERQRVAIGRALIAGPALLIADEPTGNLDPDSAGSILTLLLEQVERHGATLLMVTHNHGLLEAFDRVIDIAELAREGRE